MNLIVAVDKEWGIGYKGELLAHVRADLKNFRSLTEGKTVVLGSKTLATFPGGRPLKNRINIVLSKRPDFSPDGAVVVRSITELLDELEKYKSEDIFVIGGESVYKQLLPFCDTAYVTKFDKSFEKDTYIPNLDALPEWKCDSVGERMESDLSTDSEAGIVYYFTIYKRVKDSTLY